MVGLEGCLLLIGWSVVTIDPHHLVIMRNWECENLSVKLFLTFHLSEEIHDTSYRNSHTMSIFSICNIKGHGAALYFACKEREVHVVRGHEKRSIVDACNRWFKFFSRSFEPHRIIGLWTCLRHRDGIFPALVDTVDQLLGFHSTVNG